MNTNDNQQLEQDVNQSHASTSRKKGFCALLAAITIAGASFSTYWYFIGARYISTDNAYAAAEVATVTPAVGGIISEVNVVDTQYVNKGDILATIDNTDARIALDQASASYALAKRQVRSYLASDEGLDALVNAREQDEKRARAELDAAKANFERAKIDLQRRESLVQSGSVSGEELTNALSAFTQAQANLNAAKAAVNQAQANRLSTIGNQKANAALIDNTTIDNNPQVLLAKAHFDQAQIDLERTVIRAPISGVIAQRQVQVGRRVQVGVPLMAIVPVDDIYINANFKEVELRNVKVGQEVDVIADLYGDEVVYHGVVTGLSGGTGSAFSLIPAQNATGNWIKVVQRLPVRIALEKEALKTHPLQVGLSMEVTIDTRPDEPDEVFAKNSTAARN